MKLCCSILLLGIIYCKFSYCQNSPSQEVNIQSFIEEHFETQDTDANYEELFESFFTLHSKPLDINKCTTEELRSLFILSESQITALQKHIQSSGKLLSLYELQSIDALDQSTIDKLVPFVKIGSGNSIDNRTLWQRIKQEDNSYLLIRYEQVLQKKQGFKASSDYTPPKYLGDEGKYYMRFRTSHANDFSIGFTLEKDAGEAFIWDPSSSRYGTDFQSFHIQLLNKGIIKNAVIGDYKLQVGQGLLSNAGFNIGKSAETIHTVRRNHLGILPYTSSVEFGFFRGIASTLQYKNLDFTTFYSQRNRDATIHTDDIKKEDFITSLQSSGFHRTSSEIDAKASVRENVLGTNIAHLSRNKHFQASTTAIYTTYSTPLVINSKYYNQFDFSNRQHLILGISGSYQWQNLNIFGEVAKSQSGGVGVVSGFLSSFTSKLDFALSLRHYSVDFHSFYGKAFGESTTNKNESGTYWGVKYKHNRKLIFSTYYDKFNFPWLKSGVKSSSDGYEYLLKILFKPSKTVNLYVQYREEKKSKNVKSETNLIDITKAGIKRNFIVNTDYKSNKVLLLKTRIQMSEYTINSTTTRGLVILQDASLKFGKFSVSGRYALFQTDDYENRQYVYEKDVLYAFSIPAYHGLGSRNYLLIQYKYNRRWHFWIRYAVTHYRDRKKIGVGWEEIDGNIKSTIKLQIKIKL